MSTGGLSKPRLGRMHDVMAGHVQRGEVARTVRLGRRPGHVVAYGPQGGDGRDPDDPARLDFPQSSGRLSRFLDLGIVRAATISAPAAVVFSQVNDFHKWEAWSPWAKMDPAASSKRGWHR
jgi:hypothetical protein